MLFSPNVESSCKSFFLHAVFSMPVITVFENGKLIFHFPCCINTVPWRGILFLNCIFWGWGGIKWFTILRKGKPLKKKLSSFTPYTLPSDTGYHWEALLCFGGWGGGHLSLCVFFILTMALKNYNTHTLHVYILISGITSPNTLTKFTGVQCFFVCFVVVLFCSF